MHTLVLISKCRWTGALLYTTASVFFAGTIGARDVLFLYGSPEQSHEFAFAQAGEGTGTGIRSTSSRVRFVPPSSGSASGDYTTVAVLPQSSTESDSETDAGGLLTIWDSDAQLVLFADPATAATFWAPVIRRSTPSTIVGLENFWQFGTNATVLVGGPYLVRNATLSNEGHTLALRGDLNASVPLTVVAPRTVREVTWNGERVDVRDEGTFLSGRLTLGANVKEVRVPALKGWKFADSLPEVRSGFDDSGWTVANKTTTNLDPKPLFGDGRVLYGEFRMQCTIISQGSSVD